MHYFYDKNINFQLKSQTVSNLDPILTKESCINKYLEHITKVISQKLSCVLISKPTDFVLISGIGDNGDQINFNALGLPQSVNVDNPKEIYPLFVEDELYNLADYPCRLDLFSYLHRYCVKSDNSELKYPISSTIFCFPKELCNAFMEVYQCKKKVCLYCLEELCSQILTSIISYQDKLAVPPLVTAQLNSSKINNQFFIN